MSNLRKGSETDFPRTVSLCVVAYNEEAFLPSLLSDLLNQTYPHELIEVILIDGQSTDRTKTLMETFATSNFEEFLSIVVLDNEKRIQAAGWNLALKNTTAEVIIRIDAHARIPAEFIELNMQNLQSGEYISGGIRTCIIEKETPWRSVLLKTENSAFGSSIAKCKRAYKKEYVKTMFHAAYRREVFADSGGFNENLLRTEDNEMHYRIRKEGYRFCLDPNIKSYQYARNSLLKMVKQKFSNGYWIGLTISVCPGCVSLYNLIPCLFCIAIIISTVLAAKHMWQYAMLLWLLYFALGILNVVAINIKEGLKLSTLLMPVLFLITHISYGIGTMTGLMMIPFKWKRIKICTSVDEVRRHMKETRNN